MIKMRLTEWSRLFIQRQGDAYQNDWSAILGEEDEAEGGRVMA